MAAARFTTAMARNILDSETSGSRFEAFCIDLYSEADGKNYVPTSWNYDQARDGRADDRGGGLGTSVLSCSLRKDVFDKVEEEVKSLATKPVPKTLRFCSNQKLTERSIDDVKSLFLSALHGIEVINADGLVQIEYLAARFPKHFELHYAGELANLRSALGVPDNIDEGLSVSGMRIALTTQLGIDAQSMRGDVQKNLVLTALSDGRVVTPTALANSVTKSLHLPRAVQLSYLQSALDRLVEDKLVTSLGDGYIITPNGVSELQARTEQGSESLIEGQQVVNKILSALSGITLDKNQSNRMWNALQDELAKVFLQNGIYLTESIASNVAGETQIADHDALKTSIRAIGDRVAGLKIWAGRDVEVGQAVVDLMQDQSSDAFKWLTQLCAVYVTLCSLGLNSAAHQEIVERLRELDLILDTDVVLTYLSPGEPQHGPVKEIVQGWQRLGGSVFTTAAILEEVAYHAWISEYDYRETWKNISTYNREEALRLVGNAFVRGFRVESPNKYDPGTWNRYISMFKGRRDYDYSNVAELIKDSKIEILPEVAADAPFAKAVGDRLVTMNIEFDRDVFYPTKEIEDKCHRDGRVVAVLKAHRGVRESTNGSSVVISSSTLLRSAVRSFAKELGSPEPVIPIGAVAYLLAMLPGVSLTIGSLRGVLFDVGVSTRMSPLERTALRVIHSSKEYFLPFSRRGALRTKMREHISGLAKQLGRRGGDVADEMAKGIGDGLTHMASTVAAAMDSLVSSESEKRIQELERELATLKRQLGRS